jgi:SAM-dependent methyltransferase
MDIMPPFLRRLRASAAKDALPIQPACMSMDRMGFADESFDLIWSEGALYSIGFDNAAAACGRLLKPGGHLAATELVWLTDDRPEPAARFFAAEYPAMRTRDAVADRLQQLGFNLLDNFALPDKDWWDDFYTPLSSKLDQLREAFAGDAESNSHLDALVEEMEMRRQYPDAYGYVFYIMRRGELERWRSARRAAERTGEGEALGAGR